MQRPQRDSFPFALASRGAKRFRAVGRAVLFVLAALGCSSLHAQDRLKTLPGYARYEKMTRQMTNVVKAGALSVTWKDEGAAFEYEKEGKRFRYNIAEGRTLEIAKKSAEAPRTNSPAGTGRQGRTRPEAPR